MILARAVERLCVVLMASTAVLAAAACGATDLDPLEASDDARGDAGAVSPPPRGPSRAPEDAPPPSPDAADRFEPCEAFPSLCPPVGGAKGATLGAPIAVAPSPGIASTVALGDSNNNLSARFFERRLFVAFRTASHHHPRADARVVVLSTGDLTTWRDEGAVATGNDLREPILVEHGGRLRLYFTEVEPARTNFRPLGVQMMEREGEGVWSSPRLVLPTSTLMWRAKALDGGGLSATGYRIEGALDATNVDLLWLRSADGIAWSPFVPSKPVMHVGGWSESDVAFLDDGSVVAVVRNEGGDDDGFGSKICRAEAHALGDWTCAHDPRKFDSPLLFRHGSRVVLAARRNVTDTGHYDLGWSSLVPRAARYARYLADYWTKPKRCALWEVDPRALTVRHELDLPSRGDTCFPDVLRLSPQHYLVLDYTSPLDGEDLSWREGQNGPTRIHMMPLTLP